MGVMSGLSFFMHHRYFQNLKYKTLHKPKLCVSLPKRPGTNSAEIHGGHASSIHGTLKLVPLASNQSFSFTIGKNTKFGMGHGLAQVLCTPIPTHSKPANRPMLGPSFESLGTSLPDDNLRMSGLMSFTRSMTFSSPEPSFVACSGSNHFEIF